MPAAEVALLGVGKVATHLWPAVVIKAEVRAFIPVATREVVCVRTGWLRAAQCPLFGRRDALEPNEPIPFIGCVERQRLQHGVDVLAVRDVSLCLTDIVERSPRDDEGGAATPIARHSVEPPSERQCHEQAKPDNRECIDQPCGGRHAFAVRARALRIPAAILARVSADTGWPFIAALILARVSGDNGPCGPRGNEWRCNPVIRAVIAARCSGDFGLPLSASPILARVSGEVGCPILAALIFARCSWDIDLLILGSPASATPPARPAPPLPLPRWHCSSHRCRCCGRTPARSP